MSGCWRPSIGACSSAIYLIAEKRILLLRLSDPERSTLAEIGNGLAGRTSSW